MDNFKEEVIVRKQGRVLNSLGYIMAWILIIAFALFGMVGLTGVMAMDFQWQNIASLVIGAGVAYMMFRYKDNFRTEYEYTFTNGEMDFAMVLGNTRRKQLSSIRMREVEAGGWVENDAYDKYDQMKDVKHVDYFINSKSRLYYLFYIRDGKKTLLTMEPSQEMVSMMVQYSKSLEK